MLTNFCRDSSGKSQTYDVVSIIEFRGDVSSTGESSGHYICGVLEGKCMTWYRTNDNLPPESIRKEDISKIGYVILYRLKK